jgi:anthranilate synthase component I
MKNISIRTVKKEILADTHTPLAIYLLFRDKFQGSAILETSGTDKQSKGVSVICFDKIASFSVSCGNVNETFLNTKKSYQSKNIQVELNNFLLKLKPINTESYNKRDLNGIYGFMGFDAVRYIDTFNIREPSESSIPDILYSLYRFVLTYENSSNKLEITENCPNDEPSIMNLITSGLNKVVTYHSFFSTIGEIKSSMSDEDYLNLVDTAKKHCQRGDVFQLVLSKSYNIRYSGDEFNVYRQLRSLNPSPYMFYFDFEEFSLFGSSPESLLSIVGDQAFVNPIAGTRKRTGIQAQDQIMANELREDPKENSEHVMLVDLARNDLSKSSGDVSVDSYAEIHYYSHVMHLVSEVRGKLPPEKNRIEVLTDVFPAGTLSGAPKHKAIELIDKYEIQKRSYYGGCIGYIGFNNDLNHAILIRSFMAKNNSISFQAGAGIVQKSIAKHELLEIKNKLGALNQAIENANNHN